MKKLVSVVLCLMILFAAAAVPVGATGGQAMSVSVEYLEDGSYIVTEITQDVPVARSTRTSGSKTATHYGANGAAIWYVTVYGKFTYDYGVSSSATSATATVGIIDKNAKYVSKNAYVFGSTAYATGTVTYGVNSLSKTVSLTCDRYGNLS